MTSQTGSEVLNVGTQDISRHLICSTLICSDLKAALGLLGSMLNTIIAIGAAHALYLTLLVLVKKSKGWTEYILVAYLATLAVTFATTFFALAYELADLMAFQLNISLLLAPLFFIYIRSLTKTHDHRPDLLALHLVPYLLTWFYWLYLFTVHTEYELYVLFSETPDEELPMLFVLALLLDMLAIPIYVGWSLWILRKHKHAITNAFSYTEGIDLKWARALAYSAGVLWVGVAVPESFRGDLTWSLDEGSLQIGYASATLFIFYLGYFGLKQGHIMTGYPQVAPAIIENASDTEPEPVAKYLKSGLKEEEAHVHVETLIQYVVTEKPYVQSRLSIQDLAQALDVPVRHLSQVINEHLDQSFYDFINRYRVEEFKTRVADPRHKNYTLLSIAIDCGFNSKSSFNRIFKKFEGCTPTEYMRRSSRVTPTKAV